jgi:hypothetical protein
VLLPAGRSPLCSPLLTYVTNHGDRRLGTLRFGLIIICLAGRAAPPFLVSGVLLDDASSEPVQGAFVVLEQGAANQTEGVKTGSDGCFSFRNVLSDQCTIIAEKQGFLRVSRTIQHVRRSESSRSVGSEDAEEIQLRIVPQAAVAGRVTDSARNPLVGAIVQLSRMYLTGNRTVLSPVSQATTNDLGEYRMFGLAAGRYYVSAFYQDVGSGLGLRKASAPGTGLDAGTEEYAVTYFPESIQPEGATPMRARVGQTVREVDIRIAMSPSFRVAGK